VHKGIGQAFEAHLAPRAQMHHEQQDTQPYQVGLGVDTHFWATRIRHAIHCAGQVAQEVAHRLEQ